MRVACTLRTLRGQRSLADIEKATDADGVRVSGSIVSQIERGMTLPTDAQIPVLERAYGAPVTDWYDGRTLLVLQADEVAA